MTARAEIDSFARDGYLKIESLITLAEVRRSQGLYDHFHDGATPHYSRGNTTDGHHRARILNSHPAAMIRREREPGFDHGKSGNVRENRNAGTKRIP